MNFKIGDRVNTPHHGAGTIDDLPVEGLAWVKLDNEPIGYVRGFKLELLGAVMEEKAVKKDAGKYDATMLSQEMVELVSRVRMFGANKYARGQWKKGFKITRSLAAALRHIFSYLTGEDNDPESGLSHLGHAICSIEHAIYDAKHHPENDDRRE